MIHVVHGLNQFLETKIKDLWSVFLLDLEKLFIINDIQNSKFLWKKDPSLPAAGIRAQVDWNNHIWLKWEFR